MLGLRLICSCIIQNGWISLSGPSRGWSRQEIKCKIMDSPWKHQYSTVSSLWSIPLFHTDKQLVVVFENNLSDVFWDMVSLQGKLYEVMWHTTICIMQVQPCCHNLVAILFSVLEHFLHEALLNGFVNILVLCQVFYGPLCIPRFPLKFFMVMGLKQDESLVFSSLEMRNVSPFSN